MAAPSPETWRSRHPSMSAPHPPLARTISAPYAQGEYPHPAHDLPPLPHPPPSGSGYSYAPQQEQNSYLSPSTPSLRPRMSYTNLAQHPPSASYDPYADPSRPQQPGLPHSSSSPAYMHYPPHQPQPHPQAHTPLSPPPTANYHHPLYTPQDMRTDLPPAPPPRPTLPSPPLSSDPWTNPAPAYQHPDTSLASRPAPPLPFAPPLPPKPAFYEQEHNPSSSSGGWTVATPGLTRDSAALSDLMERESVASGDTLPPFSDSLPPGYSLSNALAAAARSAQEPAKAPEAQEQQKKGKLPARLLPDPRLVEQEARDRELALRLAQEDVPGGGLVRRDTREWEGFDEVAHAGVGEKGKGVGGEEDEDEDEEREEREARRRREQEEADRAFALELQRQVNGLPSPVDSPRAEEVPLGDEGAQEGADDAEEADRRRAQEEEALGQRMLEQRQRQEEEDAALARRLMEEMRAQAEREEERRRREREAGDAEVARRLAAGGEEPVDAERGKQEQADEDLARRLDEEAREAEVRIERSRRAHEKDLPTPAEEVETTPTQTRFSPAVRPQPPAPTPAPTQGQAQAQGSQLSPPLPSPSKSTRDRSPAREIPELDDDGWQVYDLRSFDGSAGEGSGTRPAGAGTGVDAGQQGSRHTEVWIRPGVQQPQHRPQDIPPASQLSPPTAGPSPSSASNSPHPPSPARLHPTIPTPQPLPLLPTPTSPSSALHPLNPFRNYDEPPVDDSIPPPPFTGPIPPQPFPSPPHPSAAQSSPPAPGYSPVRRPTLLPENISFDLHSLSDGPVPFPSPQPLGSPGSPPIGNPLSLYPQVFHRVDVPLKADTQFSPPAVVTSPPPDPASDNDSRSSLVNGTGSPSPGALSPSRSSSFKSRPTPVEQRVHSVSPSEHSPSPPGVTRASSSASTRSTASVRSQLSFHTAQRASTAASLATALEDLEPEDEEALRVNGALSPRTPSEGPVSPGPAPHLQAIEGIAIGFNAPASDTLFHHRKLEPIIFPDLVLLETASPMFISAPTYRALLRALAHFGSVRVEAPPALVASVKTVVQTNAVVQFSRPNQQSKQWRCILHLEVHPSQQDGQQQGRGRPASRIPARTNTLNTVVPLPQPSPALPFTMSSLADYLRKALSDSRSATSDQGKTLHRAVVQSDPEEAAKSASAEPGRQGLLSVLGIGRNNKRTDLNEDTYDLVTPFILSDT